MTYPKVRILSNLFLWYQLWLWSPSNSSCFPAKMNLRFSGKSSSIYWILGLALSMMLLCSTSRVIIFPVKVLMKFVIEHKYCCLGVLDLSLEYNKGNKDSSEVIRRTAVQRVGVNKLEVNCNCYDKSRRATKV